MDSSVLRHADILLSTAALHAARKAYVTLCSSEPLHLICIDQANRQVCRCGASRYDPPLSQSYASVHRFSCSTHCLRYPNLPGSRMALCLANEVSHIQCTLLYRSLPCACISNILHRIYTIDASGELPSRYRLRDLTKCLVSG